MTVVIAVTEVESRHVHPRLDESLEGWDVPTRRSHRAYDLRLPRRDVAWGRDGIEGDVRPAKFGSASRRLGLHGLFSFRMGMCWDVGEWWGGRKQLLWGPLGTYFCCVRGVFVR